ncbi:hypothetical protein X771_23175 [Mesorhizobium sp. LSJC277A00]|nr:hypothetical protein X771_23175 [Mesorhizobium sp. LSJC277A00]
MCCARTRRLLLLANTAIAGQCRTAWRCKPDIALDDNVGWAADQKQVFDVVATDEHQPAVAVDCRGVHDRQPCLAVPAAGNEGAEGQVADQPDDDEHDDQQDKGSKRPQQRCGISGTRHIIQPLHRCPQSAFEVEGH